MEYAAIVVNGELRRSSGFSSITWEGQGVTLLESADSIFARNYGLMLTCLDDYEGAIKAETLDDRRIRVFTYDCAGQPLDRNYNIGVIP